MFYHLKRQLSRLATIKILKSLVKNSKTKSDIESRIINTAYLDHSQSNSPMAQLASIELKDHKSQGVF